MIRSLTVWWDGAAVGSLFLDARGAIRFRYGPDWIGRSAAPPVSFSLPKRPESYSPRRCLPFFEGLLPEGAQRDAAAAALGVSPSNTFQLLAGLGEEVAGALALLPVDEGPPEVQAHGASAPLSDDELVSLLDAIRTRPFLARSVGDPRSIVRGREVGLRMSLAGAQAKIPVVLADGRIALPGRGQPTTHILKPAMPDMEASTENEAFSMRLAASLGLAVAPVRTGTAGGRSFLLVERYDRRGAADGTVDRLHQEDFCQALGVVPQRKYASDGGPGFARCFDLVRRACTFPGREALALLDAAILQVLIGNADAHGKNYSLLHDGGGPVRLAPLYDLLSTVVYPRFSPRFAMSIAGRGTLEQVRRGDWDRFSKRCGLGAPFVRRRVRELCTLADERSEAAAEATRSPGLEEGVLADLAELVGKRAGRLIGTAR